MKTLASTMVLLLCACSSDAGGFEVHFEWQDAPPDAAQRLFMVGRVEYAPSAGTAAVRTLATAGPEELLGRVQLEFSDVPIGSERRVIVELREERGSAAQVLYYGISERFELRADRRSIVPVMLKLTGVPGAAAGSGKASLSVEGLEPGHKLNRSEITLLASSEGAVALELSNRSGFPSAATRRVQLADSDTRELEGGQRAYAVPWNLDEGSTEADACTLNDCLRTVYARFLDRNGYASTVFALQLVLDRQEPQVLRDRVTRTVEPASDNVLISQSLLARLGEQGAPFVGEHSRVEISFAFDEPVDPESVRVLAAGAGRELEFEKRYGEGVTFIFALDYTGDRPLYGTPFSVEVEAQDFAGNTGRTTLGTDAQFTVDTFAPATNAAASEATQLTYVRRPYGPDPVGKARPYFAVQAPPRAAEPGAMLVLFDGPNLDTAQRLGVEGPLPADRALEVVLSREAAEVYAMVVDNAGNHSVLERVRRVDWTARFTDRVANSERGNPHRFDNRRWFQPTLFGAGSDVGQAEGLGSSSGVRVHGAGRWEGAAPSRGVDSRKYPRAAYDRARGKLVVFGGRKVNSFACDSAGSDLCGGLWEWDGRRWELRTFPDLPAGALPAPREQHAMTWDSWRGRVLMFGGRGPLDCQLPGSTFCADTWAYDGGRFSKLASGGDDQPLRRGWHTLSYDPLRDRAVLYGGQVEDGLSCAAGTVLCDDTWEWDGERWQRIQVSDGPGPRQGHASAFDPSSGTTILFGGAGRDGNVLGDTWAWNGERWQQLKAAPAQGPAPSARRDGFMAYNEHLGGVVLFGGDANGAPCDGAPACGMLWSFDGNTWQRVELAGGDGALAPPGITRGVIGEDAFGNVVIMGGERNEAVYTFRDGRFRERSGVLYAQAPAPRAAGELAHDPRTGTTVLAGGNACIGTETCNDSWLWDGSGWTSVTSANPPPDCQYGGLEFDSAAGTARLVGGRMPGAKWCTNDWEFDFASRSWSEGSEILTAGDAARPRPRRGLASAQLPAGLAIVGGDTLEGYLQDAWRLTENTWTALPDLPAPRAFGAVTSLGAQGPLLFFGGEYQGSCTAEGVFKDSRCFSGATFVGDATGWKNSSAQGPTPRDRHTLIHVDARGAALLFGGESGANCGSGLNQCDDVWEWVDDRWWPIIAADPEHDGGPSVRVDHAMVWDATRAQGFLFGGRPGEGSVAKASFGDTWLWHPGHDAAPAQVARFDFGSTAAPSNTQLESLELRWHADAKADAADGADLWVFQHGRFRKASQAGLEKVDEGSWRWSDRPSLQRLPFGPDRVLGFAQTPRGTSGKLPGYAWVETKDIELRVVYLLPEK